MPLTAEMFIEVLRERLSLLVHEDRFVVADLTPRLGPPGPGRASVTVTFVNLPESRVRERRGGGAESENNRMLFMVRGFNDPPHDADPSARVEAEQLVCNVGHPGSGAKKMRKKTADPDKVATYLANYINDVAATFAPQFTHE